MGCIVSGDTFCRRMGVSPGDMLPGTIKECKDGICGKGPLTFLRGDDLEIVLKHCKAQVGTLRWCGYKNSDTLCLQVSFALN